jgi:hypothetical protein
MDWDMHPTNSRTRDRNSTLKAIPRRLAETAFHPLGIHSKAQHRPYLQEDARAADEKLVADGRT